MKPAAQDTRVLVSLIRAAQGDPDFKKRISALLSLDPAQRQPLVHTLLTEMQLQQRPPEFMAAIAYLLNPETSTQAQQLLINEFIADPALAGPGYTFKMFMAVPVSAAACFFLTAGTITLLRTAGIAVASGIFVGATVLAAFLGATAGVLFFPRRSGGWLAALAAVDVVTALALWLAT